MTWKIFATASLLCSMASPLFAAPALNVVPGGIQAGNWVWDISITPDLTLAPGGTPIAAELGFRLTGAQLMSAALVIPGDFSPIPGNVIFGWETLTGIPPFPEGLQTNFTTDEVFAAFASTQVYTTPGPKPFLQIVAQGPGTGGPNSSTIQWLGAYGGNGRIAQLVPPPELSANFDLYAGTATQVIPEPATSALVALGAAFMIPVIQRQRRPRDRTG